MAVSEDGLRRMLSGRDVQAENLRGGRWWRIPRSSGKPSLCTGPKGAWVVPLLQMHSHAWRSAVAAFTHGSPTVQIRFQPLNAFQQTPSPKTGVRAASYEAININIARDSVVGLALTVAQQLQIPRLWKDAGAMRCLEDGIFAEGGTTEVVQKWSTVQYSTNSFVYVYVWWDLEADEQRKFSFETSKAVADCSVLMEGEDV